MNGSAPPLDPLPDVASYRKAVITHCQYEFGQRCPFIDLETLQVLVRGMLDTQGLRRQNKRAGRLTWRFDDERLLAAIAAGRAGEDTSAPNSSHSHSLLGFVDSVVSVSEYLRAPPPGSLRPPMPEAEAFLSWEDGKPATRREAAVRALEYLWLLHLLESLWKDETLNLATVGPRPTDARVFALASLATVSAPETEIIPHGALTIENAIIAERSAISLHMQKIVNERGARLGVPDAWLRAKASTGVPAAND